MNDSNYPRKPLIPGESDDHSDSESAFTPRFFYDPQQGWFVPDGFWSTLIKQLPATVLLCDFNLIVHYVNRSQTGYTMDQILGLSILKFLPQQHHALYKQMIAELRASGQPQSLETDIYEATGTIGWWSHHLSLIRIAEQDFFLSVSNNITSRKHSEIQQQEQYILTETLRETITALTSTLDPIRVMHHIMDGIGRIVPHDAVNIMLIKDDEARVAYCRGYRPELEEAIRALNFSLSEGQFASMIQSHEPCLIAQAESQPYWEAPGEAGFQLRSYLGVPILARNQVIGFINLDSQTPDFFDQKHVERLKIFAEQAAVAIQNAEIHAEISHHAEEMAKLQRATNLLFTNLSTSQSLEEVGLQIARAAIEAFELVDSGIMLLDHETRELRRLARVGNYEVGAIHAIYLDGPGLVPEAARTERTVYAPDTTRDPRYVTGDPRTRSELAIPLIANAGLLGVIDIQSSEYDAFSKSDQETLVAFAERAATAIENVLLNTEITRYALDLEERVKERAQEVYQLNEQMSIIINNTSDVILLLDGGGGIKVTNSAFQQQFMYHEAELIGQPLQMIADPSQQEALKTLYDSVIAERKSRRMEILARRKNGNTFEAEITLSHVQNAANQIVCTLHDISRLKGIERMKDAFISTVSHELRTPIAAIVLLSEALNNHLERMSQEQLLRKLQQLRTQSTVLSEMVETILNITQLEARQGERGANEIDMTDVLGEVVTELRPNAEAAQISLEVLMNEGPLYVTGDYMDFTRIWRNLISNAVKFTPEQGKIRVRLACLCEGTSLESSDSSWLEVARRYQPCVVGQVEDSGHGILPEDLENLFKRFHRGWAKYSNIPGAGLGLPLVRELLSIYGGDIHVASRPEQGSKFTFWIPIEEDQRHDEGHAGRR